MHWSHFTSGLKFGMANFVPSRFHRRPFHRIVTFEFNWKRASHFWKEHSIWNLKNRIIQIIGGRGSPWCTTPALRHPNRQKRGNGRRVKRPLSRPHTHVWRVCVDSSLLRPLACPKHTLRHSDIRCTEMKWIDEQIRKKWNERTRRSTNVRSHPQLSGANKNKRWEIRLGVWLLARVDPSTKSVKCKRRKVLQQLMDIVPVSVTLTDPSSEQLNSRPSSAFQRREFTISYVTRVRLWFNRLIH